MEANKQKTYDDMDFGIECDHDLAIAVNDALSGKSVVYRALRSYGSAVIEDNNVMVFDTFKDALKYIMSDPGSVKRLDDEEIIVLNYRNLYSLTEYPLVRIMRLHDGTMPILFLPSALKTLSLPDGIKRKHNIV